MDRITAATIMDALRSRGITIGVDCGRLFLEPRAVVTPDVISLVREHRAGLLALVQLTNHSVAHPSPMPELVSELKWRVESMRLQVPRSPAPIPFLMARPDGLQRPGCCLSCSEVLRPDSKPSACCGVVQRCRPCIEAARIALRNNQ
jgi:hypothetical protein